MRFRMLLLATAAGVPLFGQTPRAPTPTRDPLTPGYVRATELPDGAVPSPDVDDRRRRSPGVSSRPNNRKVP
jgi:hypothetical protein